jgi:hypothetical protein
VPRAAPILTAFNEGQMSRTMDGRVDFDRYGRGCKLLQNNIGLIQGPALRRGGSYFVAEQKDSSKRVWGIRFEFSESQAFVIEFGDAYCRFLTTANDFGVDNHFYQPPTGITAWNNAVAYTVGDLVIQSSVVYYCILAHTNQMPPNATYWYPLPVSTIYEIPSPYAHADLTNADGTCALKCEQSGDVVYIANQTGAYPVFKLTRFGDSRWIFVQYDPPTGPFLPDNETAITLQASAATGATNLTASAALWAATDVGRLVRLQSQNLTVAPWTSATAYVIGNTVRSSGRTYRATTNATSGVSPPVHDFGTALDGVTGVTWLYIHAGYGVARITGFTSTTVVAAVVLTDEPNGLRELPADVVSTTTLRYRLGAWSDTSGFPRALTFWRKRLWLTGRQSVWASVPQDFENHAPDFFGRTEIDNAIDESLDSEDVVDILWIVGASKLLIGTNGGEFVGEKITDSDPVGPGNFEMPRASKRRVRAVKPLLIDSVLLYVQRAGRKLLQMGFDIEIDNFGSTDLTVLSNRITRGGIIDMAYQSEPDSIVWVLLGNGRLLGFTFDQDQQVTDWHVHPIGGDGFVESIVTLPSEDGTRDELWLNVKRTINGSTKRYWEYLKKHWEGPDDDGNTGDHQVYDAFYVDGGKTYNGNFTVGAVATLTAASYLSGQSGTITVAYDLVAGGSFQAGDVGSRVHFFLDDGRIYKVLITAFTADDEVTVQLLSDAPAEVQGTAQPNWGIATTTVTGLDHLQGATVQVLADGAVHPDCVVSGGEIELQSPAAVVHAGLQYISRLVPMRLEAGAATGTAQGRIKRTNELILRLVDTLGGKVGMFNQRMDSISRRSPATPMGAPPPIFSEDVVVDFPGLYERDGLIEVRQEQPLPMMVVAIIPVMKTYET